MKRRNLIIAVSLSFLIFLAIVTNLPEGQRKTADVEQAEKDRAIAKVDSAIATAEAVAESLALQRYDTKIKTREVAQVQRRTPTATERYAGWIEEYGRNRAGEMIQAEIKEAFAEKDFKRVERLTNAQATAMRGDYERSRVRNTRTVSRVAWDDLKIGSTYRLSRQTMLMPEGRNPVNASSAIGGVKRMSAGVSFTVRGIDRSEHPIWYRVVANGHSGWINGLALSGQDLR